MLRVHFTDGDLGRTRLADRPAVMWETALSLHWLRPGSTGLLEEQWRRSVSGRLPRATALLTTLIPPRGSFPDFLTPYSPATDLAEALDPVLTAPRERLRQECARFAADRRPPPWLRDLADGESSALRHLGDALHAYHRTAVAPFWRKIRSHVAHDRHQRSERMAEGGTEALLSGLCPAVRWRHPTLEVDYPVTRDLWLDGRGLVLIPSFFCRQRPITLLRQDETPVLVYPVADRPLDLGGARDGEALAALVGHSRAAVLEAVAEECNTSELARRAGVLVSSASQHLAVLRRAGLVASRRQRNSVVHTVTRLGSWLLHEPGAGTAGPSGTG